MMYLLIIKILQVTAISMQSVLVGSELGGCAFVCGSLSFLDKMSCGLALYVLQSHQSKFFVYLSFFLSNIILTPIDRWWMCDLENGAGTSPKVDVNMNQNFYFSVTRYGLGLVPAVCSLIGVIVTYFMELDSTILKPLCQPLLLEWAETKICNGSSLVNTWNTICPS